MDCLHLINSALQEYLHSDPSGRDEDNTLLIQIKQGFELPTFTAHFFGWNPELWATSKTYEQYLEELKSAPGGGEAQEVAEVMGIVLHTDYFQCLHCTY